MVRWFAEKASYLATLIGFKVGCLTARILPGRWLLAWGDALADLGFLLFRGYRIRSMNNLRLAVLGGRVLDPRGIARRSLRNFFRACVEMMIAIETSDEERRAAIPLTGAEHLNAALAKGNGVIVLSAHLGNFFLLGTRLAMEGHAVHVLINQAKDSLLAKLMDRYRSLIRLRTIHARPRRQALREINAVLRASGIVMIIADEYRKASGVPTTLFGRTVLARRGPVTLAARTGAAVVPAYMIRQPDGSLKLVIEPELDLVRSTRGRGKTTENVLRMTKWLERTVRAYPDQWNWMNIRWWRDNEGQRSEVGNPRPAVGDQRSEIRGTFPTSDI
jgi:Kdo2-lipid IVA lauroyltransferase/acyltransferase